VSAPNEPSAPYGQPAGTAGRMTADGQRIYRLPAPQVLWWTWVAVLAFSAGDLIIQGHEFVSLQFAFGALTATGLLYACTLWSKVIAGDDGITVYNPFRRIDVPWGAVKGVFLADSVEIVCARGAEKKDKTVYCWALSSPRRARAKAQLRGRQQDRGARARPAAYGRMPGQARELTQLTPAEVMARELAGFADRTSAGHDADSVPTAVMSGKWAWLPVAAVVLPAIAFVLATVLS
jgi:Bacterial PH domain